MIPDDVRAELEQHARDEAPNEACGLIVLRDGKASTASPTAISPLAMVPA